MTEIALIYLKPRIRKVGKLWVCFTDWYHIPGTGQSPQEAYTRWKTLNERTQFYL